MLIIILIAVIVILIIVNIMSIIGMIKGLKKVEMYEATFDDIKKRINKTYAEMKEIDIMGAFEADDDVGNTFIQLKSLVDDLNNYIVENING